MYGSYSNTTSFLILMFCQSKISNKPIIKKLNKKNDLKTSKSYI